MQATADLQPSRLRDEMRRAGIPHEQTVRADVGPLHVRATGPQGQRQLYFCPINRIVLRTPLPLATRHNRIPNDLPVYYEGVERLQHLPRDCYITAQNVELSSNGVITFAIREDTQIELCNV